MNRDQRGASWWDVAVFSFVLATLQLLIFRYQFGTDVQVETLCQIYRKLNPDFLTKDFFVNASDDFGARTYYATIVAAMCRVIPIPYVFWFLSWISHALVVGATFTFARNLFRGSDTAGYVSGGMVLAVTGFSIAGYAVLQARTLVPAIVALPWALLAMTQALQGRAVASFAFTTIAAIIHPVGLEVGFIALATVGVSSLWELRQDATGERRQAVRNLISASLCGLVLGALTYLFWIRPYEAILSPERFRDIYAQFRVPHHLVPTTFGLKSWALLGMFLVAVTSMGISCYLRNEFERLIAIRGAIAVVIVLLICIAGYVGVEIVPIRAIIAANVFRLLNLVKWIGLVVLGGTIVGLLKSSSAARSPWYGLTLWAANGPWQPAIILGVWLIRWGHERLAPHRLRWAGMVVLSIVLFILSRVGHREEGGAVILYGLVATWFLVVPRPLVRRTLPLAACIAVVATLAMARHHPETRIAQMLARYQPILSMEDNQDEVFALGKSIRERTDKDAVLLVPPDGPRFRLTANRAVVVDLKAFPFNDSAMQEWYDRVTFCYGPFSRPFKLSDNEVLNNYLAITDDKIADVGRAYGATHAVLYRATETRYPVLIETPRYQVVAIEANQPRT
ncbi:MAG: hypothetical protein AMXMBFR82_43870 [Candidatus Hydrogenedentota bacterium]